MTVQNGPMSQPGTGGRSLSPSPCEICDNRTRRITEMRSVSVEAPDVFSPHRGLSESAAPALHPIGGACKVSNMTDETAIRDLIEARAEAMRRKDAKAAVALLADDIVAFEMVPPLVLPPAAVNNEQVMAGWFAGWEGPIEIEIRDLVVHADRDVAFAHSLNRLAGTRLGGARTDIWMRSTLGFCRTHSGWQIVHGHTSVPFDPADGFKVCLDLKP